jgi:hypothetical protein
MEDNSRKRVRSSSPAPVELLSVLPKQTDAIRAARLRDPNTRTAALNELLRLTGAHEHVFALESDAILKELSRIVLVDCLQWNEQEPELLVNKKHRDVAVFSSDTAWTKAPTARGQRWAAFWKQRLDGNAKQVVLLGQQHDTLKTMQVIFVILRNLSYVAANIRLLVYSPRIVVDLLIGCLYEGFNDKTINNEEASLQLSAIQTLLHLAPYFDMSGRKLVADRLFYQQNNDGPVVPDQDIDFGLIADNSWGFGGLWLAKRLDTREDIVANVNKSFLLALTANYLESIWSLFPALCHVVCDSKTPRAVILLAVDLLQELINHARIGVVGDVQLEDKPDEIPNIRAVLVKMPDAMVQRLTDLLYVPRLGSDSLDYVNPVHRQVTRLTPLRLLAGYDASIDADVRDRALDVLVPLMELDSPRMAARLGVDSDGHPRLRLFDSILPILTTAVGRNEAQMMASQMLRELSKASENNVAFLYVQERLIELASKDARVSHLVWNHLYVKPVFQETTEEPSDIVAGVNEVGV